MSAADRADQAAAAWALGDHAGADFVYAHLNRLIRERDLNVTYVIGPGRGRPGLLANTWLEGSYSQANPEVSQDEDGMRALFRQFSFPGGVPGHVAPEVPVRSMFLDPVHDGAVLPILHLNGYKIANPTVLARIPHEELDALLRHAMSQAQIPSGCIGTWPLCWSRCSTRSGRSSARPATAGGRGGR